MIDEEIKEKIKNQKKLFRKLMAELNGKTMDYESCSMLEEFFNDYTQVTLNSIEQAMLKIKKEYDLVPKKKEKVLG